MMVENDRDIEIEEVPTGCGAGTRFIARAKAPAGALNAEGFGGSVRAALLELAVNLNRVLNRRTSQPVALASDDVATPVKQ